MSTEEFALQRLSDLLKNLREDLDLEVKSWLNLRDSNHDKANLAKAIIAMANHGGGTIVLGFKEHSGEMSEDEGRPEDLGVYSQDIINGIVQGYCDPSFQCAVRMVSDQHGAKFPVISVRGGHKVPIRARKGGPHGNELQNNAIYIRRPGPSSEEPRSYDDWDQLLSRCLKNRGEDFLDQIRGFLSGSAQQKNQGATDAKLDRWINESYERWHEKIENLSDGSEARFPHGHYCFSYEIIGEGKKIEFTDLLETLRECEQPFTGWPLFQCPFGENIVPVIIGGSVECWLGGDTRNQVDAMHSDFWRFHPEGLGFFLRGYHIDYVESAKPPGTMFYINIPIWRVGEALLHAQTVSRKLFATPEGIRFVAKFTGLRGRKLAYGVSGGSHYIPTGNADAAAEDTVKLSKYIGVSEIDHRLPELVHSLLTDLFVHFGFSRIELNTVTNELNRMINKI